MGKFDYSLDLGADLERAGQIENTHKEVVPEVKKEVEKHKKTAKINKTHLVMLLVLLIIGYSYLTLPAKLAFFDIQANAELTNNLRDSITARIFQTNPLISPQGLQKQVLEELNQVKNTETFKTELIKRTKQLKEWYKDSDGQVYLYKIDPYYYYRMTNQYVLWGQFEHPTLKGAEEYYTDPLRTSPRGEGVYPTLLSYFTVYFYKFLSIFSTVSVMTAAFYLPVIFGLLSIICFFFIAHKLFQSEVVAFLSTLLFSLHQRFFIGNFAGNADTQILALFFTLLVMLIFVYFIDFNNKVRSIILFFLFFPVLFLFSRAWPSGYQYVYVIILSFVAVYSVFNFIKSLFEKKASYWYLLLLLVPLFFYNKLTEIISRGLSKISATGMEANVGELQASSLSSIIDALGGVVLSLIVVLTILFLIYKNVKELNKYELFVIVWFIPLLYAGFLSRRFTYYVAPSFCLLVGFGIYYTYPFLTNFLNNFSLPIKKENNKWIVCVILSLLILTVISDDILASRELFPEVNDAIFNTADFIKENSNESAIIITGMNKGYVWQALAMRGTISDGANWGGIREISLYKLFSSENLETAKNITFILSTAKDIGGYKKFNQSELFFVIDKDTFSGLSEYYHLSRLSVEEYQTIQPNPLAVSELYDCFTMQDGKLLCAANFVIDLTNLNATQQGTHPDSLVVVEKGLRKEKTFEDGVGDFTLFVFEGNEGYQSFFVDKKLKNTLAARLYSGESVEGFEVLNIEDLPERIVIYKFA